MKRIFALVSSFFLFSMLLAFPVQGGSLKSPKGFEGKLWQSTMVLYAIDDIPHADCTIQPYEKIPSGYRLLTAGHCVQEIPADVKFAVADEIKGKLTPVTLIKAYDGDGLDFAIFEMKTTKKYAVMELGNEHALRVGDTVINPNFALGIGKQLGVGRVSSDSIIKSSKCPDCAGQFLVQIDGGGGSSGSAVISTRTHKVVGLVTAAWSDDTNSQIGMFVEPISVFKTFLTAPVQPHPAPQKEVVTPFEIIIQ